MWNTNADQTRWPPWPDRVDSSLQRTDSGGLSASKSFSGGHFQLPFPTSTSGTLGWPTQLPLEVQRAPLTALFLFDESHPPKGILDPASTSVSAAHPQFSHRSQLRGHLSPGWLPVLPSLASSWGSLPTLLFTMFPPLTHIWRMAP